MKINCTVTQEKIDKGIALSKCACPIANTINDELRENHTDLWSNPAQRAYSIVSVDATEGRIHLNNIRDISFIFKLPDSARKFIEDRDAKRPVAPFQFSINTVEC